jgi:hypothetical protein
MNVSLEQVVGCDRRVNIQIRRPEIEVPAQYLDRWKWVCEIETSAELRIRSEFGCPRLERRHSVVELSSDDLECGLPLTEQVCGEGSDPSSSSGRRRKAGARRYAVKPRIVCSQP